MRVFQFVDQVAASPTVRLDLNSWTSGLLVGDEGLELPPPPVRRTEVGSQYIDGEIITGWVYGNRRIVLPLQLVGQATVDAAADVLQRLGRELARDSNLLRVQLGSTPVFFETLAAPDYGWRMVRLLAEDGRATVTIPARPFGLGLERTVGPFTVVNDSAEGTTLNSNPNFETDASGWTTVGCTFVRSTAQAHEGAASGLLTPDGVTGDVSVESDHPTIVPLARYTGSVWVRCAVARSIDLHVQWLNSADGFISNSGVATSVSATTWTLLRHTAVAPSNAVKAAVRVRMTGTPPGSNTLHIDQARLLQPGTPPAMSLDVTGVVGDVDTPLLLRLDNTSLLLDDVRRPVIAARRRGDPNAMRWELQCEEATFGADTAGDSSVQPNDAAMSGGGANNFVRTTFASQTVMYKRMSLPAIPAVAGEDARGLYGIYLRYRRSDATSVFRVLMSYKAAAAGADERLRSVVTLPLTTQPRWIYLGTVPVPAGPAPVSWGLSGTGIVIEAGTVRIGLHAARDSGTGTLDWDVVHLLPADDWTCTIQYGDGSPAEWIVDGVARAMWARNASGQAAATAPARVGSGWPMISPGETNRIFFLGNAASTNVDTLGESQPVSGSYWPRYLMLPGPS